MPTSQTNGAVDSFMKAMHQQRGMPSESALTDDDHSREPTEEPFSSPPPHGPRAPTVETPARLRQVTAETTSGTSVDTHGVDVVDPDQARHCDSSESDEDLNTTQSEFVATRMFFNQTCTADDASPIVKLPVASGDRRVATDKDEEEPDARAPLSGTATTMSGEGEQPFAESNFSPLARRPTSLAADIKGTHTPSKLIDTPDVTGATTDGDDASAFDRSTRPSRDDSEFFFVDNHDGTGYLTNATRQDDGSYLLGQTVLMAQSRRLNQSFVDSPCGDGGACARMRCGAASPVVVPPSMTASPLPHQMRLREDAAAEAAAELDLGATRNLMMSQSFADSMALAGGAGASLSMDSFGSPSISRIIARAKNDLQCGATPQRGPAPRRSAAPPRSAAKQLAFDSSLVLDSSFALTNRSMLAQSLRTDLGMDSGFSSPMFSSPLPRRQRGAVGEGASLGESFTAGGAASPIPDAPSEEPYVVREARAAREAGVDRVYVQPPASEVTADDLTERGWLPVFVDFRRKPTDYEFSPTAQSPIPNDPRRADTGVDGEEDGREASLSRQDDFNASFTSSAGLDQTVLKNINRRLSMSMSSLYPGSLAGSPHLGPTGASVTTAVPPSTPLAQIMRRQSSSSVWSTQSPQPVAPDANTPFKRECSPSRASMAASFSVRQGTHISDLLTSLSMPQRSSADGYSTSHTAFLTNTEGSTNTGALSYSGQASSMMTAGLQGAARRRVSNATATSTGTGSPAGSVGLGGRSVQSAGLGTSFRVTHCKRASMGPTTLKGAMPLSRGHLLSASTSTGRAHVDPAHTRPVVENQPSSRPHAAHTQGRAVNRGHQLDCAAPVRRTTLEKPDTSSFVPWSPLTITPENSVNLGAGWNAAAPNSADVSPASPPRAGQSVATAPGCSPDKASESAGVMGPMTASAGPQEMQWVPFTASATTDGTDTSAEENGSGWGQPSLSLAMSGLDPAAVQALKNGILAAMQSPQPHDEVDPTASLAFEAQAGRSAAMPRDGTALGDGAVESFPASLMGATVMDNLANMDSAATSAMMQSITLFAANEMSHQRRQPLPSPTVDDSEPEPRLSTAVVTSIAQRWVAEQQRSGKENGLDSLMRAVSGSSKRASKSASASPGRQPSLSARAPSELNENRHPSTSS